VRTTWPPSRAEPTGRLVRRVTYVAPIAIAPSLAGADHDLDRTAAIAWPARRAIHITVAAGAVTAILGATALTGHPLNQAGPISRNVISLAGLIALGAATVGPSRAWLLPLTWTVLLLWYTPPFGTPPSHPVPLQMLTWLMQPAGTTSATAAAISLGIAGTVSYAIIGPADEPATVNRRDSSAVTRIRPLTAVMVLALLGGCSGGPPPVGKPAPIPVTATITDAQILTTGHA